MKLTKRQHYVPEVYLRAWSDEKGKLVVYNKENGSHIKPNVDNICLEKYYYGDPVAPPNNELERKFWEYEGAFGPTRDFLLFICKNAVEAGQPVGRTLADALNALPKHANVLKSFAGTLYFRVPGALQALQEQLAADNTRDAATAQKGLGSPYTLNVMAFESTLLDRFRRLHIAVFYSEAKRLDTADRLCLPIASGTGHSNFWL